MNLSKDTRGGVTLIVAGGMVAFLGMAAFAVDLGSVYLDSRKLQGVGIGDALRRAGGMTGATYGEVLARRCRSGRS